MKVVLPLFIILVVCVLAYAINKAVRSARGRSASGAEAYGQECEMMVYDLLRSVLPRKNVFSNLYFPVRKDGRVLWTETDSVCITRGGVIVAEVKGAKGVIENPAEGDWTQRYGDKVLTFHNPYLQNKGHVIAVKKVLGNAGISIPVYNVVVFTDKNTRFTNKYSWLMRADKLVDFAALLDDKPVMNKNTLKAARSALSAYTGKRGPSAAEQYR